MELQTLLLTVSPSLAILAYIIASDRFKEPPKTIIAAFILGYLICLPAGQLNHMLIESTSEPENFSFIAGFVEETLKFLAIGLFLWDRVEFDEPMDAIVYGTLVSLGFATFENYEYVYVWNEDYSSFSIAALRAVSAIPLHACCGIIMGFYIGRYFKSNSRKHLLLALFVPITAHATYNYLDTFYMIFLVGLMGITWRMHYLIKREQANVN